MASEVSFQMRSVSLAAAVVFGFVVCVGVSTSPISSLFAQGAVQSKIAPVATAPGSVATAPRHGPITRRVRASAEQVDALEAEVTSASASNHGFGLPLVLAGLSVTLLGMASWLVRPRRHVAMASTVGTRNIALQAVDDAVAPVKIVDSMQSMLTPLGYYEAYELVVVVSPRLTEMEKEDRLATLELLFTQNKCKKVEKLDRGRRLLAYPIRGSIEAYIVLYTFKAPRTMPKIINDWFVGPGLNSDGNVFRCFLCKQRRVKKGASLSGQGEDEMPMWSV